MGEGLSSNHKRNLFSFSETLLAIGVAEDDIHQAWEWCIQRKDMPRETNTDFDGLLIRKIQSAKTGETLLLIIKETPHGSDERLWAIVRYAWMMYPETVVQMISWSPEYPL